MRKRIGMCLYCSFVFIIILSFTVALVACKGSTDGESDSSNSVEVGTGDTGSDDTGSDDTGDDNTATNCSGPWYQANLTWYESYPEEGSEECTDYNGCEWAGQFYGLDGVQTEEWVAAHNIASVHLDDWDWLGMQAIKIRQGDHEIIATVYDACSPQTGGIRIIPYFR